VVLQIGELVN